MSWEQYRTTMERYAIKIDDIATENAYFMATHMPFSQLDVFAGGDTNGRSIPKLEDEIFDELIYNPNNEHRMIIVRGGNGTGKSHLIRYLKAKFENSPATVYDPNTEQIIFLRRLNNSVRGAFSQLLEQKVIKDPDIEEKLRKFVASSDSRDEESFKIDILLAYVSAVDSDRSGETYKPIVCRNIAQFLSDSRVKDHLMREDGAISRCYRVITTPSDQVLKETTVFTEQDFAVQKLLREVISKGNDEAKDFASTIKGDDDEIAKLVGYLNRFTRAVIQRCADISSEDTKSVFEQLRRDLKRQGKNLTLFVEDFTGFTGIDSELITVLSVEHGGDYSDLCRVTSVIGITDAYYRQFRDNFKDRVTHQILVTEDSYSEASFLVNMAARYLNAIYCDPKQILEWYRPGASLDELPINTFSPPVEWDSVDIGAGTTTLYPFNRKSLLTLYEGLDKKQGKTPRMFLKEVIRAQLKEYFDGKIYGSEWAFPINPSAVPMSNGPDSSSIDRLDSLPVEDRARLKSVLAIWGDGSASIKKSADGTQLIGGLDQRFLADIGLGSFMGIGKAQEIDLPDSEDAPVVTPEPVQPPDPVRQQKEDTATRDYKRKRADIDAWFNNGELLKYHPDYREWLRTFLCGSGTYSGAINWQDLGVPAFIAAERLSDKSVFFIEGQDETTPRDKALVVMERTPECRDALLALLEYQYASRSWDFKGSAFYQQKLITWLERNKRSIIEKVSSAASYETRLPVIEWCLALQYMKAMIFGKPIDTKTPLSAVKSLFEPIVRDKGIERVTPEWNSLISFVENEGAAFDGALQLLQMASNTTMGAIQGAKGTSVFVFHGDELLSAAEKLIACGWDIEAELPSFSDKNLLHNPAILLKNLYGKIGATVKAEQKQLDILQKKIEGYTGEITEKNLIDTIKAIKDMYTAFAQYGIPFNGKIRDQYDGAPIDHARRILKITTDFKNAASAGTTHQLSVFSGNGLKMLSNFLRDLTEVERIAQTEQAKAEKEITGTRGNAIVDSLSQDAANELDKLCSAIEKMEVQHAD